MKRSFFWFFLHGTPPAEACVVLLPLGSSARCRHASAHSCLTLLPSLRDDVLICVYSCQYMDTMRTITIPMPGRASRVESEPRRYASYDTISSNRSNAATAEERIDVAASYSGPPGFSIQSGVSSFPFSLAHVAGKAIELHDSLPANYKFLRRWRMPASPFIT